MLSLGTRRERILRKLDRSRRSIARIEDRLAWWQFRRLGLQALFDDAFVAGLSESSARTSCGELWALFQAVSRHRPRVVFEFGSGYSTLVIAEALLRNGPPADPGRLYSFDASAAWAERARGMLLPRHAAVCEVRHSALRVRRLAGERVCLHDGLPDRIPDMVFLDGPGGIAGVEGAADVLLLEPRLPQDFLLIVDGRKRNFRLLERHLERPFAYSEARGVLRRSFRLRMLRFTTPPKPPGAVLARQEPAFSSSLPKTIQLPSGSSTEKSRRP
jgi:hypothetical protein